MSSQVHNELLERKPGDKCKKRVNDTVGFEVAMRDAVPSKERDDPVDTLQLGEGPRLGPAEDEALRDLRDSSCDVARITWQALNLACNELAQAGWPMVALTLRCGR